MGHISNLLLSMKKTSFDSNSLNEMESGHFEYDNDSSELEKHSYSRRESRMSPGGRICSSRVYRKRAKNLDRRISFLVILLGLFFIYFQLKHKGTQRPNSPKSSFTRPITFGRRILQYTEENENASSTTTLADPTTQLESNSSEAGHEQEKNCTERSIHEFPRDVFSEEQKRQGALVIHFLVCIYMFFALAIVCDDYFVPSLEHISERLKLTEDVAGATFMAAGSSAPELFTSVIAVFTARGDVGVGTIVGSAVFNILVIVGLCALCCSENVPLHWWPLMRDSSYYGLAVAVLIVVIYDGLVTWYESLVMLLMYSGYIVIMKFNADIEKLIRIAREKTVRRLRGNKKKDENKSYKDEISCTSSEQKLNQENIAMSSRDDVRIKTPGQSHMTGNGRVADTEVGASAALLDRATNGDTPQLRSPTDEQIENGVRPSTKSVCASKKGLSVVAQLAPTSPTMVPLDEVIFARSRPMGFEEAGLRVMMSSTFAPKTRLRMACKILINEHQNVVVKRSDNATERVLVRRKTDMSLDETISPAHTERCASDTLEDVRSAGTVEENDGLDFTHPFRIPKDNCKKFVKWLLVWPISFLFFITIPNCSKERWKKWFMVSFIMSTLWIAVCSYIMVWMGVICGYILNIPDSIMGITILAAGTSVPDTIASVIVARQGLGDMAVSNSIGSNVFDILLGLALPWFLKSAIVTSGSTVVINSRGLLWSVLLLLASLLLVIVLVHLNGWQLTRKLGIVIMAMYGVFLTLSILIEYNVFFLVNLPMCEN